MTYEEMVAFLKNRRIELGLSQAKLADKLQGTQQTIGRFENFGRRVNTEIIIRIADALDCDIIIVPRDKTE